MLQFLRSFEAWASERPQESAILALTELLNEEQESPRLYLSIAQLRIQAVAVPVLMEPHEGTTGYRSFVRHYPDIIEMTRRLQLASQYQATQVMSAVESASWSALEFADDVLGIRDAEPALTAEQESDYLNQIRAVIDAVSEDEALSPQDRTRIVDLLRKVEQALLDIKINGSLPVQEAAAAAGAIVRLTLWEKVQARAWVKPFYTAVGGLTLILENTANTIAITEYVKKMIGQ